jgi:hypothetical protein
VNLLLRLAFLVVFGLVTVAVYLPSAWYIYVAPRCPVVFLVFSSVRGLWEYIYIPKVNIDLRLVRSRRWFPRRVSRSCCNAGRRGYDGREWRNEG